MPVCSSFSTIESTSCAVASIITFIQCLNANIVPFIIHEENKAEYEDNCKETISLEIFFRKEQLRFYDETEAMVIDQI